MTEVISLGLWFSEKICVDYMHSFRVSELLFRKKSKYQLIEVIKHEVFGKILFLDGKPQVTEFDEWIYHESLVHPPMILHGSPKDVLIIGGGDGGALREVLKHPTVKNIVLVDLDPEVMNVVRKYLPEIPGGAFDDSRVKIIHEDGRKYVENTDSKFDVIIVDVTDPCSGIASKLFTKEFYKVCKNSLREDGVIVTQAESVNFSHLYFEISFPTICRTIKEEFKNVHPYQAFVPSFASCWGFVLASNAHSVKELNKEHVETRLKDIKTKFLNPMAFASLFSLPKNVLENIDRYGKVISDRKAELLLKKLKKTHKLAQKINFDKLI